MSIPILPLADMHNRHPGLTHAIAAVYLEAACVCLDRHHVSPQSATIREEKATVMAQVVWNAPDAAICAAWANEIDTTEAGAYAMVLAAAELLKGLYAVRRAETATGADYYVGEQGAGIDDLEDCLRLEVSGTDSSDERELSRRLSAKVAQASRGNSSLPALAGVVGFPHCTILFRHVV